MLRRCSGLNYFTSALVILASVLAIGLVQQILYGPKRCALALGSFTRLLWHCRGSWGPMCAC